MILVISSKKVYAVKRLLQEARVKKQELRVMDMAELVACKFMPKFKFNVLYIRDPYAKGSAKYLPQIISFAKKALKLGVRVVDANIVKGKIGEGKWKDYQILKKVKISIPHTVIASASEAISLIKGLPRSSGALGTRNDTNYPLSTTHYSLVLKWIYGMGGKNTFLIRSENKFKKVLSLHPISEWMVQEYIPADFEYKVICVGFKALPVVLKIKFNKKTGRPEFEKYNVFFLPLDGGGEVGVTKDNQTKISHPPLTPPVEGGELKQVITLAEKASRILGRELSKVDILEKDGKFYVLEVNRFPGLEGFEKLTKYNVVKEFVSYLQK